MNFYSWAIQNGYTDTLSIDRIDVDGNYALSGLDGFGGVDPVDGQYLLLALLEVPLADKVGIGDNLFPMRLHSSITSISSESVTLVAISWRPLALHLA